MQSAMTHKTAAVTARVVRTPKFRLIETEAVESLPSSQDDYGEGDVRPSVFYFRRALRQAQTVERARIVGLGICSELERVKAWIEEQGFTPPKWLVDPAEAEEKGWTSST